MTEQRNGLKKSQRLRFLILSLTLLIAGGILLGGAAYYQLVRSNETKDLLDSGSGKQMSIAAPRGNILDAQNNPVAFTRKATNIYVAYTGLDNATLNKVLLDLAELLDRYNRPYAQAVKAYFDLDTMSFADGPINMIEWQQDRNFLGLKPLPDHKQESATEGTYVKLSPQVFYDFMCNKKFEIPASFTAEQRKKVFALRFVLYLQNWFYSQGRPIKVADDVPEELAHIIAEQNYIYRGCLTAETPHRVYSEDAKYMAHVVGYVGDITAEEYQELAASGYGYDDVVGKSGLELVTERYLHGTAGIAPYHVWQGEVEAGQYTGSKEVNQGFYPGKETQSGYDVKMTLNADVQKAALESMAQYLKSISQLDDNPDKGKGLAGGTAVMLDLKDGGIVAMANYPYYDPNDFINADTDKEAAERVQEALSDNGRKPMLNRAISQLYPPGSTFKIFTGLSAMESGTVKADTKYYCGHYLDVDGQPFRCEGTHGETDLEKALAYSCNIYFYHAGMDTGIDRLTETYKKLQLGELTGVELYGETAGARPSRQLKASLYDDPGDQQWFRADTAQVSIGQGLNSYTVLQLARATGAVATGKLTAPHVIDRVTDGSGAVVFQSKTDLQDLSFSQNSLNAVRNGMRRVVTDPNSTAYSSFLGMPVSVAGKTGTAETYYQGKVATTNGIFVCFAPFDDPQVAICVAAESGGRGAGVNQVAADMLKAYYASLERQKNQPAADQSPSAEATAEAGQPTARGSSAGQGLIQPAIPGNSTATQPTAPAAPGNPTAAQPTAPATPGNPTAAMPPPSAGAPLPSRAAATVGPAAAVAKERGRPLSAWTLALPGQIRRVPRSTGPAAEVSWSILGFLSPTAVGKSTGIN